MQLVINKFRFASGQFLGNDRDSLNARQTGAGCLTTLDTSLEFVRIALSIHITGISIRIALNSVGSCSFILTVSNTGMNVTDQHQSSIQLGYRMPAEWEPQEAIWLSWPHNRETWPGAYEPVPKVFAQIARHISESQLVRINVPDQEMADNAERLIGDAGGKVENLRFHFNETNDCWVRDHGPIYLVRDVDGKRERALTNWIYNSWGGKYPPFDLDNRIPERIEKEFNEPIFNFPIVLEGGSIDVNGCGTLLTTTSCLLHKNRNPELNQAAIEQTLRNGLGVENILWLGDGIVGDDTDGHIDDITRFVAPGKIVTAIEDSASDPNYLPLKANHERLEKMTDQHGQNFDIVSLPMPKPVFFEEHRLPASYANFLICNEKVLVPTYRCEKDDVALSILQDCFPDRQIVGIDCTDLAWGLGAIHCVTQQQPAVGDLTDFITN